MLEDKVDTFARDPKKALWKLSLPIIIAMLVQTLYNVVDTAFVGRLGAESIAALTFAFPIFFIMIAVNQGIATGMNSRVSRFIGAKHYKQADNTVFHALLISVVYAGIAFLVGMVYLEKLFLFMGAEKVLGLSMSYMTVILGGVFVLAPASVILRTFMAQGDTKTPMGIEVAALLLNIILDPIFIYVLGYGVQGAAIATVISFSFALILGLFFLKTKSHLSLSLENFHFRADLIKDIVKVGLPASAMMMLMSIYIMFINKLMAFFGTDYVASFGLASRLHSVGAMPIFAIGMSLMTMVGMFYGAKKFAELKMIVKYGIKMSFIMASCIAAFFFVFPDLFMKVFTNNPVLIGIGVPYIRIEVFSLPLMAIGFVAGRILQGMGHGMPAFFATFLRLIMVGLPLAYVAVYLWGFSYLWVAISAIAGGVVSVITLSIWLKITMDKLV